MRNPPSRVSVEPGPSIQLPHKAACSRPPTSSTPRGSSANHGFRWGDRPTASINNLATNNVAPKYVHEARHPSLIGPRLFQRPKDVSERETQEVCNC